MLEFQLNLITIMKTSFKKGLSPLVINKDKTRRKAQIVKIVLIMASLKVIVIKRIFRI